jgi:hypothetical protein
MARVAVVENSRTAADGALVHDITFAADERPATTGYLVEPTASTVAGILYFHWLESSADDSNRSEFLDEAKRMAGRGALSLLVEGELPWHRRPQGSAIDRSVIQSQLTSLRAGLDLLVERGADPGSLAVVGHDFGAMYGILLAVADRRPRAYVLMAATPRWGDWFVPYWKLKESAADYAHGMTGMEPIDAVAHAAPAALLFQFARRDHQYVPIPVANEFFAAASAPKDLRWYSCGHRMNHLAERERETWLADQLGLAATE